MNNKRKKNQKMTAEEFAEFLKNLEKRQKSQKKAESKEELSDDLSRGKGKNSNSSYVLCPFYLNHFQKRQMQYVSCEYFVRNSGFDITMKHYFRLKQEMIDYMELFCCDRYESCPYYKIVLQGYNKELK